LTLFCLLRVLVSFLFCFVKFMLLSRVFESLFLLVVL
jgi:hypothetical protein